MQDGKQRPAADGEFRGRESFVEGAAVVGARWLQVAAIIWLALASPHYGSSLPSPVGDALYWFSWLAMILGSFTLVAIACRRPDFRRSLVSSVILLWIFLGICLLAV